MFDQHAINAATFHLASLLTDYDAGCDPEFDAVYDELEREFAELRLQLANNA